MRTGAMCVLLTAALAATAADPPAEAVKAELKKLEGKWVVGEATFDGKKLPAEEVNDLTMVFTGDQFNLLLKGKELYSGTVKLDPTKTPGWIDTTITSGKLKGMTDLGLYKLDGDKFTTAFVESEKPTRPTTFEGKEGSKLEVTVWKRAK